MTRALALLPAALAAAALAAGCGSSSSSSTTTPTAQAPATSGGATAGGVAIKMQNTAFSPKTTTVKVGEKVTWTNDDPFDHNVTSTGGPMTFKSGTFGQGGSFSITPTKAGTIAYVCTIHPGMDGTLVVKG